jgi:hypothetical protein
MKTLKQLAAEKSFYTLNDLPKKWKDSEYSKHKIDLGHLSSHFLNLKQLCGDDIEIDYFYECRTQDAGTNKEIYYIEHAATLLRKKDSQIVCSLIGNRNKYFVHPHWRFHNFNEMSGYERQNAVKDLKEPNRIGVFSQKKLIAWLNYCDEYASAINNKINVINTKNEANQKEIDNFVKSCKGSKVEGYANKVWVTAKLFEVIFEMDKSSGFMSKKITFKGTIDDIVKLQNK